MIKSLSILDTEYEQWVESLIDRYRSSQLKAAIKVNTEQLKFNWTLGHDIETMNVEERWGEGVITQLSKDLKKKMPGVEGLSVTNLRYCRRFYILYSQEGLFRPQAGGELPSPLPALAWDNIFSIPWGHHKLIMDKAKGNIEKALFYVGKVVENNWSRSLLMNHIDSDLYERSGKAISNFRTQLPEIEGGLAQELTKDPYNFAFAGIREDYNESLLKKALLTNISDFLIELGTGFAYVGREYRLQIGDTENFIDLLFYNLKLRCYVVVEVKIRKFDPKDIGQLGTYVVAANHILRDSKKDNPTIGLLICRGKDNTVARYALESTTQLIGISEYELEKFYPENIVGTIPTIKEIEKKFNKDNRQ